MTTRFYRVLISGLVVGLMPLATGCGLFGPPTRTTDGGGGNLVTAGAKVLGGQLTALTQDEVQLLSDQIRQAAINAGLPPPPELTNEQADAYLDFLNANNLSSFDAILKFTQDAIADPSIVVIPQSVLDAFTGTEIVIGDGSVKLADLFALVFTGS